MSTPLKASPSLARAYPTAAVVAAGTQASSQTWRTLLFALTLFTSASLVFIVEPMFGKMVLPRLGGTPAVWNTCMVFYQAVLLAGYAYAHVLSRRCSQTVQIAVHSILLFAAAFAPLSIPAEWVPPVDRSPIPSLIAQLGRGVGFPLLMLCATTPLLQKWFSKGNDGAARDPYFLYAASNVGSILALLAFPLVIEPSLTVTLQRTYWAYGYLALIVLTLCCGWVTWRQSVAGARDVPVDLPAPSAVAERSATWHQRARWFALALVPSSLMLGTTTHISTDVASAPLLWTIPLALYLLSFVIGFSTRRVVPDAYVSKAATGLLVIAVLVLGRGASLPTIPQLALQLTLLLLLSTALHTALAQSRPEPRHLTEFYLWISVGGVAGGLFNSLLAPLVFTSIAEYPLALIAAAALLPGSTQPFRWHHLAWAAVAGAATAATYFVVQQPDPPMAALVPATMLLAFGYLLAKRSRAGLTCAVAFVFCGALFAKPYDGNLMLASRTFFGVVRVWNVEQTGQHRLMHGTTLHGIQNTAPERQQEPLSYYHRSGPIGQVFTALNPHLPTARIGVVGLGAGTLAAYAQPGQQWSFFEIDPEVVRIARNPAFFTYLGRCPQCTITLGDARLALSHSTTGRFDLLVLDAFSSDAIPMHLMTREALDVYLQHLNPGGILVFHVSNRHLALRQLVGALAAERQLVARAQFFNDKAGDGTRMASEWVVLARHESDLDTLGSDPRWKRIDVDQRTTVWTDDFSDILSVLKL